ncbi:hypothetical protein COCON_G00227290 [Conger conger]|uniref:Cation efflux protein transmembrane domain-containing protein n=1 Tax=Conger conger TaxID=82655 RepID=A0A9Q1CXS6_CONCO|nr:hypothetical protein COCON_G00227290 [Conger conger]
MAMDSSSTSPPGLHYQNVGDYYPRKLGPKPDVVPSGITERKSSFLDKPDMVVVDVISLKEPDFPVHRKKQDTDTYVLGTIRPFRKTQRSVFGKFAQEFLLVASDRRSWKILLFGGLNIICIGCLVMWGKATNSMALTAYSYLSIFHLFSLGTCLVSSWVTMKKPTAAYTFGFERFEVLAVFATTVLIQLGALFILKESIERFVEQPEVHTGRLLVGTFVALFFNLLTLLSVENKPFTCVSEAASTNCLQEHVADLSRRPRVRGGGYGLRWAPDQVAPDRVPQRGRGQRHRDCPGQRDEPLALTKLCTNQKITQSQKVFFKIRQTTPSHLIGQLDKLLREVSTLDGVLEVRNEHFWTVGFGSLAGSIHVRVGREAGEQMVLAHVTSRLHALVAPLTVQIFKDDWIRPSPVPGALPAAPPGAPGPRPPPPVDVLTSTPAKPGPPPEFSFHTPGRSGQPLLLPGAQAYRPHSLGLESHGSPYSAALSQGWARPHLGRPPAPGYRTAYSPAPQRYGAHTPPRHFSYRS